MCFRMGEYSGAKPCRVFQFSYCEPFCRLGLHQAAEYERENERVRARLRSKPRVTSEHAACRMECRFITAEEVERTLVDGKVDARHSTPNARPCPKIALNMGRVRAVWADCADSTRLVTAIDAETNHPCGPC